MRQSLGDQHAHIRQHDACAEIREPRHPYQLLGFEPSDPPGLSLGRVPHAPVGEGCGEDDPVTFADSSARAALTTWPLTTRTISTCGYSYSMSIAILMRVLVFSPARFTRTDTGVYSAGRLSMILRTHTITSAAMRSMPVSTTHPVVTIAYAKIRPTAMRISQNIRPESSRTLWSSRP